MFGWRSLSKEFDKKKKNKLPKFFIIDKKNGLNFTLRLIEMP